MNHPNHIVWILLAFIIFVPVDGTMAQYKVESSSFNNGTMTDSNTSHQMQSVVGPSISGRGENDSYKVQTGFLSLATILPTRIEQVSENKPVQFRLEQNFPNPFNPETTIRYSINNPGRVTLRIYDMRGREVATLIDGNQQTGQYSVHFRSDGLPSGIYIYTLNADAFFQTRKMIIME